MINLANCLSISPITSGLKALFREALEGLVKRLGGGGIQTPSFVRPTWRSPCSNRATRPRRANFRPRHSTLAADNWRIVSADRVPEELAADQLATSNPSRPNRGRARAEPRGARRSHRNGDTAPDPQQCTRNLASQPFGLPLPLARRRLHLAVPDES